MKNEDSGAEKKNIDIEFPSHHGLVLILLQMAHAQPEMEKFLQWVFSESVAARFR